MQKTIRVVQVENEPAAAEDEGTFARRPREITIPIWLRLVRFMHRGEARIRRHLRAYDLNPAQFDVIAQVGRREGLMQRELAERLVVTPGNITQLLDRMEADGLVLRSHQGRCNRLSLTARGRDLFRTVVPEQEALIGEQFASLSRMELETLSRIARGLLRHSPE